MLRERACKLDFPALHESNFVTYITECQILGPKSQFKSIFGAEKSIKSRLWTQKSILSIVFLLIMNVTNLFAIISWGKSRKTIFDKRKIYTSIT